MAFKHDATDCKSVKKVAFIFRGNTSTAATSPQFNLPMQIEGFSLVNKTAAAIGVNVYIIDYNSSAQISVAPYGAQLAANQMYEGTQRIYINPNDQVRVVTNGSTDYYFNMNNVEVPQ